MGASVYKCMPVRSRSTQPEGVCFPGQSWCLHSLATHENHKWDISSLISVFNHQLPALELHLGMCSGTQVLLHRKLFDDSHQTGPMSPSTRKDVHSAYGRAGEGLPTSMSGLGSLVPDGGLPAPLTPWDSGPPVTLFRSILCFFSASGASSSEPGFHGLLRGEMPALSASC